ncbi:MAG TPA: hypothetical protein VKE22_04825 [Haliangiales bacterium]|nr:hypothetical protein [Haliangiales bacterium]
MSAGDVGVRLDAFLEWVRDGGVAAARLPAWRPIAERLLALAGSGRVLEGHILSLIDASQGSPGQITLIEEVGEALLRYQALAKPTEPRPTREMPKLVTPAIQRPPVPARPSTGPVAAPPPAPPRDPDRATSRMRVPTPAPGEKLVSFDVPSQPPAPPAAPAAPATTVPTPPPAMAVGSTPPAPTGGGGRISNVHFRCPKCKVMVAANDEGVCPQCGTRPPAPVATAAEPARRVAWKRAAVAAAILLAAFAIWRVGARLVDRLSHPSVAGSYPARSVGLEITFQDGWRRRAEGQANLGSLGLDEPMAVARFTRDDSDLAVGTAARPADFNDARLAELADAGPEKVAASLHPLAGAVRLDRCLAEGRRLRCLGADGDRRVAAYVALLPKRVAVVVLRSRRNLEEITAEGDALVENLKPL